MRSAAFDLPAVAQKKAEARATEHGHLQAGAAARVNIAGGHNTPDSVGKTGDRAVLDRAPVRGRIDFNTVAATAGNAPNFETV